MNDWLFRREKKQKKSEKKEQNISLKKEVFAIFISNKQIYIIKSNIKRSKCSIQFLQKI